MSESMLTRSSMMHCPSCATEVRGKQLYCSNCGAEIISNRPKAPEQKDADERYFDNIEKTIKTHQGNRFSDRLIRKSAKARMVLTAIIVPVVLIMLASTVCMFLVFFFTAPWDEEISKAKIFFFIPLTVSLIIVIIGLVRFWPKGPVNIECKHVYIYAWVWRSISISSSW